ncbi:MAG: hypothetical protein IJV00_07310, partial [Clostridia bacterium]|nr:hypothetical protein [Clostridia bacterium]
AFVLFLVLNTASRVEPDANILYLGPKTFNLTQIDEITSTLNSKILTSDHNGDGKIVSDIISLRPVVTGTDENGETVYETAFAEQFRLEINSGDTVIFIIESESIYDKLVEDDLLMPLVEIFGEVPANADDAYSFKFGDTDMSKLDYFDVFTKNARLCFRYPRVVNGVASEQAKELSELNKKAFKDMISYRFKTEDNLANS